MNSINLDKIKCFVFLDKDQSQKNLKSIVEKMDFFKIIVNGNYCFLEKDFDISTLISLAYNRENVDLENPKTFIMDAYLFNKIIDNTSVNIDMISLLFQFIVIDCEEFNTPEGIEDAISTIRKIEKSNDYGVVCFDQSRFILYITNDKLEKINKTLFMISSFTIGGSNENIFLPKIIVGSSFSINGADDFSLNKIFNHKNFEQSE